jgi:hypothetical protein
MTETKNAAVLDWSFSSQHSVINLTAAAEIHLLNQVIEVLRAQTECILLGRNTIYSLYFISLIWTALLFFSDRRATTSMFLTRSVSVSSALDHNDRWKYFVVTSGLVGSSVKVSLSRDWKESTSQLRFRPISWSRWLLHIFLHYLINDTIFGGGEGGEGSYWTWNVCFHFLYKVAWNISHSKKNLERYCHKCKNVFM